MEEDILHGFQIAASPRHVTRGYKPAPRWGGIKTGTLFQRIEHRSAGCTSLRSTDDREAPAIDDVPFSRDVTIAAMPGFGHESRFQFVIPSIEGQDPRQRQADVYAAGRWLTCTDNSVYVPQFVSCLVRDLDRILRDDGSLPRFRRPFPDLSAAENHRRLRAEAAGDGDNSRYLLHRFMEWGPTADNVSAHLFIDDGIASIPFSFWCEDHHDPAERGRIFVAELPERELMRVLSAAAWELENGAWARR